MWVWEEAISHPGTMAGGKAGPYTPPRTVSRCTVLSPVPHRAHGVHNSPGMYTPRLSLFALLEVSWTGLRVIIPARRNPGEGLITAGRHLTPGFKSHYWQFWSKVAKMTVFDLPNETPPFNGPSARNEPEGHSGLFLKGFRRAEKSRNGLKTSSRTWAKVQKTPVSSIWFKCYCTESLIR